ncbi:hypothetical protein ACQCSX_14395 [Pseudarthrobacter sp. P1]
MLHVLAQGGSIQEIAREVDRTQLGTAWKLFNIHAVKVPSRLLEGAAEEL